MISFNLLPWREKEKIIIKQLLTTWLITIILTLGILTLWFKNIVRHAYLVQQSNHDALTQIARNKTYIKESSASHHRNAATNNKISARRTNLQNMAASLFAKINRYTPLSIYLRSIINHDGYITLQGNAKSIMPILHMIQTVSQDKRCSDVVLREISDDDQDQEFNKQFIITFKMAY